MPTKYTWYGTDPDQAITIVEDPRLHAVRHEPGVDLLDSLGSEKADALRGKTDVRLNLRGAGVVVVEARTDLVVLSACQTGRGRFVRGEGVMGLARALMYAGAPRTVASLWLVDDAASRALMESFHKHHAKGVPAAEALRRAQIEIRDHEVEERGKDGKTKKTKPWSQPRYWAAWVLWGLPD